MNKQKKLQILKDLQKNPRVSEFRYNKQILERGHDDSIWYDDTVLSFVIDNRYYYECQAVGEIDIIYLPTDESERSKGNNAYGIREFLYDHNLTTDNKISKAESKGDFYFQNNNWFEDHILDMSNKEWIDDGLDISDGPFSLGSDGLIEYLDEIIKDRI